MIKKNIPNIITLGNLCCGLIAIIVLNGDMFLRSSLEVVGYFIFLGSILDLLDGLFARLLNIESKFGKQLDSLADMITFGVAPGLILYELIKDTLGEPLAFTALLIPLCSAIRLAKFNLDKRQTSSFIGLPTPIAAIFIASLIFSHIFWCDYILYFSFILPLLLVSNISFFSLKFNNQENIRSGLNIMRIILLIVSLILFYFYLFAAIPFIVVLYIILSIVNNYIFKKNEI